jgi:hypothetical protein
VKPSEVLLAARELVAGGWTKGAFARTARGQSVSFRAKQANCFCLFGAVARAAGREGGPSMRYLNRVVTTETDPDISIVRYNDEPERTHLNVVVALEKAALLAMSEGQ